MRHRRDHGIDHIRVGEQQVLHLLRIDVLAAAAEHVVDAAAEIEEPVLVLAEDIAGVQPAIGELGTRDLRLVVIAEANVGAADQELAFLGLGGRSASISRSSISVRARRGCRAGPAGRPIAPRNGLPPSVKP